MANGLELRSMALLLRSMALLQDLDTLLHGHELRRPQLCCGAYAVQRAEGGEPLEQIGVNHLRRRSCGERYREA